MTHLILDLHAAVVFLLPFSFGWLVLRRLVREHDLSVLIPASLVLGFAALMGLINELRCWLEMSAAVWTAYKILLASDAVLLVWGRPPRSRAMLPRETRRGWKIALVATGAVVTGFYFGVPAFGGFLDDSWWGHYPLGIQIQTASHFPLSHPFAVDDHLYYHIGPDIIAATLAHLFLLPIQQGYALTVCVFATAGFLLAFSLMLRLSRRYFSALLAGTFMMVGGNLRFLELIRHHPVSVPQALGIFNSQTIQGLIQMIFTPSHCVGVPLVLLTLAVFRHFLSRPSWRLGLVLGVLLGSTTLAAEWYFLILWVGLALAMTARFKPWRLGADRSRRTAVFSGLGVLLLALGIGLYDNSYLSGYFSFLWVRQDPAPSRFYARVAEEALSHRRPVPSLLPIELWTAPQMAPVRLNLEHFGQIPSWESAGSNSSTWIPLLSLRFAEEFLPVVGLGLGFGIWWWRRSRHPLVLTLAAMAALSLAPPVLLDWGYRSTDLLRFLTGTYCFSALLAGCLVGRWLYSPSWRRGLAVGLLGITMANAIGLGILGLLPATMQTVKAVQSSGTSLSEIGARRDAGVLTADHDQALLSLASQLDHFLYPLAHGQDRVLVIVSPAQLPPLKIFPEWMKLATLSRVLLPVGWYWEESQYTALYHQANRSLDADALAALGVRWVVVTDLWGYASPPGVDRALQDQSRFFPAHTFRYRGNFLTLYRAF